VTKSSEFVNIISIEINTKITKEDKMEKVVFLTGATGFVGGNIVIRLLDDPTVSRILLLVRGKSQSNTEERLYNNLQEINSTKILPNSTVKIEIIQGDVTLPNLGLTDELYENLAKRVTHIIHSAANVSFTQTLEEARRVNYLGTENLLKFAQLAKLLNGLQQLGYIGTAYVSGNRKGIIFEDELVKPSAFANPYEQSKFETEKLVRSYFKDLPITIFKPSIIIGDSETGITTTFNVLYYPLKLIYKGYLHAIPGSRRNNIDVVPVDYVVNAICHILFHATEVVGKVYHLTSGTDAAITAGEIIDLTLEYFNETKVSNIAKTIFIPAIFYNASKRFYSGTLKKLVKNLEVYLPYLLVKRMFDNSNTQNALRGSGIKPPNFKEYYRTVLGYCLIVNWGKHIKVAA